MRILFVGDIVGRSGRTVVHERLPKLVRDWKLDLVVVNGENAAGGFGITEAIYRELLDAGLIPLAAIPHCDELVFGAARSPLVPAACSRSMVTLSSQDRNLCSRCG